MRVLVCGGRDFEDSVKMWDILDELLLHPDSMVLKEDIVIIDGGAKGADTCGYEWARMNYLRSERFFANWDKHKKAAGPIRNQQMLEEGKPDLVLAFPTESSRGTWHMVKIAQQAGIDVRIYK